MPEGDDVMGEAETRKGVRNGEEWRDGEKGGRKGRQGGSG